MIEQIILGIAQGITEWLPVSSEGMIVLIQETFFNKIGLETIIEQSLFLHLGTFLAALIYFRKEVFSLLRTFFHYKESDLETKKLFNFLILVSLISGSFGFVLMKFFTGLVNQGSFFSPKIITLIVGVLLLITAGLQIKLKKAGEREKKDLNIKDGIILGIIQGFAVLPGLSRSGLTISTLLIKRFKNSEALVLSFLMSLPIVLGGNIILNLDRFSFNFNNLIGLFLSFIFGLLTINLLLKIAKRINFGWFIFIFGLIVIASAFI